MVISVVYTPPFLAVEHVRETAAMADVSCGMQSSA